MSGPLRHIALTVEQTGRSAYAWLLIESADNSVFVLKKAQRTYTSYLDALDAGYQELALLSACGLHARAPRDTGEEIFRKLELGGLQHAL